MESQMNQPKRERFTTIAIDGKRGVLVTEINPATEIVLSREMLREAYSKVNDDGVILVALERELFGEGEK